MQHDAEEHAEARECEAGAVTAGFRHGARADCRPEGEARGQGVHGEPDQCANPPEGMVGGRSIILAVVVIRVPTPVFALHFMVVEAEEPLQHEEHQESDQGGKHDVVHARRLDPVKTRVD